MMVVTPLQFSKKTEILKPPKKVGKKIMQKNNRVDLAVAVEMLF
jgi:hypothetical protein